MLRLCYCFGFVVPRILRHVCACVGEPTSQQRSGRQRSLHSWCCGPRIGVFLLKIVLHVKFFKPYVLGRSVIVDSTMPWFLPWSDSIKKRACRYLLQRYLGQFLEEKLTLDQLTVDLYNGTGSVSDVSLDVQVKACPFRNFQ